MRVSHAFYLQAFVLVETLGLHPGLIQIIESLLLERHGGDPANIGALIIRIGFGVCYTIIIIRNPQNPILIIKALHYALCIAQDAEDVAWRLRESLEPGPESPIPLH